MRDVEAFVKSMSGLAEVMGIELSEAKLAIYEDCLSKFSDQQILRAISEAARTLRFFPKPVELVELIEGKSEDRAVEAWGVVLKAIKTIGKYQSIMFEDGKIAHVVEMMGGWIELCSMRADETSIKSAQFQKMYRACSGEYDQKQLAGICEHQRALEGTRWQDRLPDLRPLLIGSNGNGIMQIDRKEPDLEAPRIEEFDSIHSE